MSKLSLKIITAAAVLLLSGSVFAETVHLVKKGDTLYGISKKYQITVSELRAANNLSENDVLKAGQKLVIPNADLEAAATLASSSTNTQTVKTSGKTEVYTVQKGDTLYGIAKKHNVKVSELYAVNGMTQNDVLKFGQKIKIPVDDGSESPLDIKDVDPRVYRESSSAKGLKWPVVNPTVTYVKGKVSGVQLTSAAKENVTNIHAGTVVYTGFYRGFGNVVFVQSKTGLVYAYTGLSSIKVKNGTYVVFGDVLGKAGVDSITKKNGIMLMVIQNGEYIDPAKAPRS